MPNTIGYWSYGGAGWDAAWEAGLALLLLWQVLTGNLIYKRFRAKRADDPAGFWVGITLQIVPLAGCVCISNNFVAGVYFFGVLYFGMALAAMIGLVWIAFRGIRRMDPAYTSWKLRKFPRVYWLFMTWRPRRAAEELHSLLRERPGDKEVLSLLEGAYAQTGQRDAGDNKAHPTGR